MKKPLMDEKRSGSDRRTGKDRREFGKTLSTDERRTGAERRVTEDRRVHDAMERLFMLT